MRHQGSRPVQNRRARNTSHLIFGPAVTKITKITKIKKISKNLENLTRFHTAAHVHKMYTLKNIHEISSENHSRFGSWVRPWAIYQGST